eukprot:gene4941-7624_t
MGTVGLIVSAEYGSDGGGWTDVRAAVEKHGIAVVKETTPGPSDDSDHLRVVYSLRGEGGMLDFNRPSVGGLPFFAARKLNPSEKYGCAVPQAGSAGPFQFATGCSCPVGQRCRSRVVDFVHSGVKYTSSMGLCGCCAGWVIALVIGVPVLCLVTAAGFCTRPFARLTTHVLGGREKALAKYRRVPPVQTQPAPGDNPNPLADDVWSPVGGAMSQRSAASSTSPRRCPILAGPFAYTSSTGLCGCCAGWVIALVMGLPVLCLARFCTRPFARLTTHVLGGREKALAKYRRVPPVQTQPAPGDNPNLLADCYLHMGFRLLGPFDDSAHLRVVYSLRGEGGMPDFNRPSVGGLRSAGCRSARRGE